MKKIFVPALAFAALVAVAEPVKVLADVEGEDALSKTGGIEPSGSCTMVDFETPDAKAAFKSSFRRPRAAIVERFASSGKKALELKWDRSHRMGFTIRVPETDFTPFDRLAIDVVNVGDTADQLTLHVAAAGEKLDDSIYTANGKRSTHYAKVGKSTWIVELNRWPKKAEKSRKRVSELRFYALHPYGAKMYLDNIRLLKKGVEAKLPKYSPADEAAIAAAVKAVAGRERADREQAKQNLAQAMKKNGFAAKGMLWGVATSMEHVLPKDPAALGKLRAVSSLSLSLARGESESLQMVVAPEKAAALRNVTVRCVGLDGLQAKCSVLGYSKTMYQAPYAVGKTHWTNAADRAGYVRRGYFPRPDWYPDVILEHVSKTDVASDVAQGFWVRVSCPHGKAEGICRGALVLSADGVDEVRVPLEVKVYGFSLPKTAALPVAMNFNPSGGLGWLPSDAEVAERTAAKSDPAAPVNIWKKRHMEWVDFLADYFITYDFLYRVSRSKFDPQPNWDALMHLKKQGRLGYFNLAYWGKRGEGEKAERGWREKTVPYYKAIYDRAKELGILDKAFFYGNDELNPKDFPAIRRSAEYIHREFPGVPLFTTARDVDFGVGTNSLENVEWFCPLTGRYDFERAEKARKAGRKIWWYVCDGPTWNCANLHIENKPIDARSLLGAQSLFFKADGFLYWQVCKWHSPRTIGENPFTDWVAASCFGFNGEGCIAAVGPDGIPLPTVRLENFRDGLEDYAYAAILKERIAKSRGNEAWLKRARELVAVPPTLVKSLSNFSDDPAAIGVWRREMAELIERSSKRM